ncbi:hypothetical protein BD779DRAFT_1683482 [Infundibulicybe gibba]|nr:hypothetical protein BD779DRAFT_1683482 [Infundibulicybe gibba]
MSSTIGIGTVLRLHLCNASCSSLSQTRDERLTLPPLASSSFRNPTSPSLANEKSGAAHTESFDGTVTVARDHGPLSAIPIPPTLPAHVYLSTFIPPPSPPPLLLFSI